MVDGQTPGVARTKGPEGGHAKPLSEEAIREELNRVLAGHEFRTSKRSQDFLRYVVENTLHGHADMLKERTIGMDVFGRSADYDPSDDATVRVKAGEVRKRLGLYYAEQGLHNPVRIELPGGTYVPEFRWSDAPAAPEVPPQPEVAQAPAETVAPKPRSRRWLLAGGIVVLAATGLATVLLVRTGPAGVLDEFWAPVLGGNTPVMVCAAFVPVWNLDLPPGSTERPRLENYVELTDQFVGGGDLIAVSRLTAMLTRGRRPYRLKIGNDVSFHDLRTSPAILVGYSYTQWREISSQLRYFIDGMRRPIGILDNGAPTKWSLPNLPRDRRTNEDYAIVTRVFHPDTHAMLVEIAGITQYGTDAGSDLVTNPELMAEALRGAPAGWQNKNLQLILHVKVISGTPSSPRVVATYFW